MIRSLAFPVVLLFTALILLQSCGENDTSLEKYPEGVSREVYRIYPTNGSGFTESRIHPPHWWTQMADPELELLIYDQDVAFWDVRVENSKIILDSVYRLANPNYLFCKLYLGPGVEPGEFDIVLYRDSLEKRIPYELKKRTEATDWVDPVTESDVVYLLMPDRFSNGDEYNDTVPRMRQQGIDRNKLYFRHGGDIQGIINHLDYLQSLGISALWLNPVLENDQPYESYHGYAITDHYRVDPRLGSNDLYIKLSDICREKGMHLIKDLIFNHVGNYHWFIQDLPDPDWIHQPDSFVRTSYRAPVLMDPHASRYDRERFQNAWFDHHMPDLNQRHPRLARYLIQNTIWWIEEAGIDGLRLDTYAYSDQGFMKKWAQSIRREYPDLYIYGETWVHGPGIQSWFNPQAKNMNPNAAPISGLTDFQLHYAILEALTKKQGWTEGLSRVYYTLAQDYLYPDPGKHLIFLDNHDLSRFYSILDESYPRYEQALAMLFTMRGIPCIYYGTEILMKNHSDPDGKVRMDFPGGWEGDAANKFLAEERSKSENEAWQFVSELAHLRHEQQALQNGQMIQFIPENDIYTYFRLGKNNSYMIIINNDRSSKSIDLSPYREIIDEFPTPGSILSGQLSEDKRSINIEGNGFALMEWRRE